MKVFTVPSGWRKIPPESEREAMAQRVASDPRLQSSMKVMGFAKQTIVEEHFQGEFLDIKVLVEPLPEIEAFSSLESLVNETKQPLLNRKEIASILNISLVTLT